MIFFFLIFFGLLWAVTPMTELGSNFTDFKKLGFRDEAALTKAHKSIDLKYLGS
jgi:hypothetical protein